jgi:hypothetical protein
MITLELLHGRNVDMVVVANGQEIRTSAQITETDPPSL